MNKPTADQVTERLSQSLREILGDSWAITYTDREDDGLTLTLQAWGLAEEVQ